MWEDLWNNLKSNLVASILVIVWPLFVTVVIWLGKHWTKDANRGLLDCLYLAISSYAGVGEADPYPKIGWLRWVMLVNGLFGIFALAYVVAILVVSLR